MSEETKDIILDVKDSLNETPKNMYKYNKITLNLNEFEEILNYIEQLENIIKEVREYATNRQKWLLNNCNKLHKVGIHNYINFTQDILEILDKGE